MILTVAHLIDPSRHCDDVTRRVARCDGRALLIHTVDEPRSGVELCRAAVHEPHTMGPTAVITTARALHTMLPHLVSHYDDVLIDVRGVDGPLVRTAIGLSDEVVIPMGPWEDVSDDHSARLEALLREFMMTVEIQRHHRQSLIARVELTGNTGPTWLNDALTASTGWQMKLNHVA